MGSSTLLNQIIPSSHPIRPVLQDLPSAANIQNPLQNPPLRQQQQPSLGMDSNAGGPNPRAGLTGLPLSSNQARHDPHMCPDLPSSKLGSGIGPGSGSGLGNLHDKNQFLEQLSTHDLDKALSSLGVGRSAGLCVRPSPRQQEPGPNSHAHGVDHRTSAGNDSEGGGQGRATSAVEFRHAAGRTGRNLPDAAPLHGHLDDEPETEEDDGDGMPSFDLLAPGPNARDKTKQPPIPAVSGTRSPAVLQPRLASLSGYDIPGGGVIPQDPGAHYSARPPLPVHHRHHLKRRLSLHDGNDKEEDKYAPVPAAVMERMKLGADSLRQCPLGSPGSTLGARKFIFSGLSQAEPETTAWPSSSPAVSVSIVHDSPDRLAWNETSAMLHANDHDHGSEQDRRPLIRSCLTKIQDSFHSTIGQSVQHVSADPTSTQEGERTTAGRKAANASGSLIRSLLGGDEEDVSIE